MSPDDREAIDDLDRYLDRLVGGRPFLPEGEGLDPDLAEASRQFHALDARDHVPNPNPAFRRRLQEDLMHRAAISFSNRPLADVPGASTTANGRPRGLPLRPGHNPGGRSRRWSPLPWLATAAVVLLTLASGFAAYRLAPSSPNDDRTFFAGPGATVEAPAGAVPGSEECRVAPVLLDRWALTGTPSVPPAVPLPPGPYEGSPGVSEDGLPADRGRPADAAAVAGVAAAVRELVACLNADDPARITALFTDDYWRRLNGLEFGVGVDPRPRPPLVASPSGPVPVPTVADARLLPDGRIAAVLLPSFVEDETFFNYYVFARAGDRWLIDEAVAVGDFFEVEVVIRDDGFSPAALSAPAGPSLEFVVRNEGTTPHSFVLPELDERIEVAPGQSVEQESLDLSPGAWPFFSDLPGDREAGLAGTLVVRGADGATPVPDEERSAAGPAYPVPLASVTIEACPPGRFAPDSLAILADRDVVVPLRNVAGDCAAGTFTIDGLGISVDLGAGETKEVTINAPAGVYAFYSALPGHAQAGMVGTLFVVDEAPLAP